MRSVRGAGAALVVMAAAVALAYFAGALEPSERRPGLRLHGETVSEAASDWRFSDADKLVELESRAPWLLPHSVPAVGATPNGRDAWAEWHAAPPGERPTVAFVRLDPRD